MNTKTLTSGIHQLLRDKQRRHPTGDKTNVGKEEEEQLPKLSHLEAIHLQAMATSTSLSKQTMTTTPRVVETTINLG